MLFPCWRQPNAGAWATSSVLSATPVPTCRFSRCSTSQRSPIQKGEDRSRSTTTVAQPSAALRLHDQRPAHGSLPGTTVCQLHMRHFKDGDELYLEPWRARAFP